MNRIGDYVPGAGYCAQILAHRGTPPGVYEIDGVGASAVVSDSMREFTGITDAIDPDFAAFALSPADAAGIVYIEAGGSRFDPLILTAAEEEHGAIVWTATLPVSFPCGNVRRMLRGHAADGGLVAMVCPVV